jgi:hypothetical protein
MPAIDQSLDCHLVIAVVCFLVETDGVIRYFKTMLLYGLKNDSVKVDSVSDTILIKDLTMFDFSVDWPKKQGFNPFP